MTEQDERKKCRHCEAPFEGHGNRVYCSDHCYKRSKVEQSLATWFRYKETRPDFKEEVCDYCQTYIIVPSSKRGPSSHPECKIAKRKDRNRRRNNSRRKFPYAKRQANFLAVAEKDNWVCWICEIKIDPDIPSTNRMGATIDHVIPISKGGSNKMENLRIAHWICNVKRGNRVD